MYKLHVFIHKHECMSCINCLQPVFPSTLACCISSYRQHLSSYIYASFPFISIHFQQHRIARDCFIFILTHLTQDSTSPSREYAWRETIEHVIMIEKYVFDCISNCQYISHTCKCIYIYISYSDHMHTHVLIYHLYM